MKVQNENEKKKTELELEEQRKLELEEKKKKLNKSVKIRDLIGDDVELIIDVLNKLDLSYLLDSETINIKTIILRVILKYKECKDSLFMFLDEVAIDEKEKSNKWKLRKIKDCLNLILLDEAFTDLFTYTPAHLVPKK